MIVRRIRTNAKEFVPRNFAIHNFYGKDTCFAWSSDKLTTFPYICGDSPVVSTLLKAPANIKDIRGFNGRIFVLCSPCGIYKLSEKFDFAVLSKSGLELLSEFSVLSLNDGNLILRDKTSESIVKLLSLSVIISIYALVLNYNNTDNSFYKTLAADDCKSDRVTYLLAIDKKLFKLVNQTLQVIYESDHLIKSIVAFEKDNQVFGVLLTTDSPTVILIHAIENKLFYDSIILGTSVSTVVYPVLCTNKNVLLIHLYNEETCYSVTQLATNSVRSVKLEKIQLLDIKLESNFIIYLDNSSNLILFPIEEMRNLSKENSCDYVALQSNMLKGLESVIDDVCEKTLELKALRQEMLQKEDVLKRINMFVNKQTIKHCPKESVVRLLNNLFLICDFKQSLLEHCTIVKGLKSAGKMIFLMKDVHDYDTIVEMPINLSNLSSKLHTTTDLVTFKRNNGIWCLIKDYIQDQVSSNQTVLTKDKRNNVKYNLVVLRNLMRDNKLTMESLSEMKRKIRNAMQSC